MANRFYFPVEPTEEGSTLCRTYASVTCSVLLLIKALGGSFAGIRVCPGQGYFDVILHRYPGDPNNGRRVRLRFNLPNLYLQAFKSQGVWYVFPDQHPIIVPAGAPAHRYVVELLPFESGYTHGGLEADFNTLTFGRNVVFDIYVTLRDFPNNAGGMERLKKDLRPLLGGHALPDPETLPCLAPEVDGQQRDGQKPPMDV